VTTEQVARDTTINGYHFVGGCAVGSVLDADLKVKGVRSLRVVDASAIPGIPQNAGPSPSVFMLAEHAAERIIAGK
jgi:choline dehydrogenase